MSPSEATRLKPLRVLAAGNAQSRAKLPISIAQLIREAPQPKVPLEVAIELVGSMAGATRSEQRHLSEALQSLAPHSPQISEALELMLASADPDLRWGAAYTLGKLTPNHKKIWPAIRGMLGAEDGDSRWAAAEITCTMARQSTSLQDELRTATRTGEGTLRRMALYCLRDLQTHDLFALARERLADTEGPGRLSALTTLLKTEVPQEERASLAGELVAILTTDPIPGVRRAAAATIGKLQLREARFALARACQSEDPSLAKAARQAIGRLPPG